MSSLKGQVFTPDFTASVVFFSFFLLVFGTVWNTSIDAFTQRQSVEEVQHDYSFDLLKTSGSPRNWNRTNVETPGLYRDGYLSAEKFLEFYNLPVSEQRTFLRAEDFYMSITDLQGDVLSYSGRNLETYSDTGVGSLEVPQNQTVYASREVTVLDETGKRVQLRYYTWEE